MLSGAAAGLVCMDMSTIGAPATRAIGAELAGAGVELLDAPVTGSSPRAEAGTLTIMVGGSEQAFERAETAAARRWASWWCAWGSSGRGRR